MMARILWPRRLVRSLEKVLRNLWGDIPFRRVTPAQVMVLGFAVVILTGALLLKLPFATRSGVSESFVNTLFTATSATCVTGLVVVDTGTHWSLFGQLVILALIQIGGLGFMTLSTVIALMLRQRIGLRSRLLIQESMNQLTTEGMVRLIISVLIATALFEGMGALLLSWRFVRDYGLARGVYFGVFHAVSAFCNAGFDLLGGFRSLTGYVRDWTVSLTISSLIIIGGLGFGVLVDLWRMRRFSRLMLHSRMVLLISAFLILTGTVLILWLERDNPATLGRLARPHQVLAAYFQAVTPRTAGFNSVPIDKLEPATLLLMIILMFIGASPGSTGGGIKTTTFGVILLTLWHLSRGKSEVTFLQRRLALPNILRAFALGALAVGWITFITFLLSLTETFPLQKLLFEVTSAFGTVGLSTGITPQLSVPGRFLITLTMFSGRVGLLTIATALGQRTLVTRQQFHFSEERVLIG